MSNKSKKYSYEDAWNYLVTLFQGVSQVSDGISIKKLQEIMFGLESRIDRDDTE